MTRNDRKRTFERTFEHVRRANIQTFEVKVRPALLSVYTVHTSTGGLHFKYVF